MNRLFGLLAGAIASFVTTYVSAKRRQIKERHPRVRRGICGPECRIENRPDWKELKESDPRSPRFLSYLETTWLQDLSPQEAVDTTAANMERIMFGQATMLLDDLVDRNELSAHEAQHLRSYYEALIFRTIVRH